MHHLYFVLLREEHDEPPQEIIRLAERTLEGEAFACSDGGYFASGKCDYFKMGGRWSGVLSYVLRKLSHDEMYARTTEYPHDDDAMILTPELRARLLEEHADVELYDNEECTERKISDLKETDDGKWIVVVDYHN